MTVLHNSEHRAAGTIRFNKHVTFDELVAAAKDLHSKNPDQWVDIHIRGAGKDGSRYVAFIARLKDDRKKTHHQFTQSVLDCFRESFGTDECGRPFNCKGWTIATVDFMV